MLDDEVVSELANLHVIALQKILGRDEDLVLLTECNSSSSMNLWLLAKVPRNRDKVTYLVTNGPEGEFTLSRAFTDIFAAKGFYQEVRAEGSWSTLSPKLLLSLTGAV